MTRPNVRRTPARLGLGRSLRAAISGVIMGALLTSALPAWANVPAQAALGIAVSLRGKVFYASSYGATGAAADDCPAIQNALNAAATAGANSATGAPSLVVLDAPHYNCLTAITYDPAVTSVEGNGTTIDATSAAITGPLVTVAQSHKVSQSNAYYPTYKNFFRDVFFLGPGKASTTDLFYFGGSNTGANASYNSRATLTNIAAAKFRYGVTLDSNAFLFKFDRFAFHQMTYCFYNPTNGAVVNSGEALSFSHGVCGESTQGFLNGNANMRVNIQDVSFDFDTVWLEASYGQIDCLNCHFESTYSAVSTPPLVVNNFTGSLVTLRGGDIAIDGGGTVTGATCFANVFADGALKMDGVFQQNMLIGSNVFACGAGPVLMTNSDAPKFGSNYTNLHGYGVDVPGSNPLYGNLLSDGSFEQTGVQDLVWVSSDTATVTSRLTGTNLTIATSTDTAAFGSRSLKLTKAGASGTNAAAMVCAPFPKNQLPAFSGQWAKVGAQTGSIVYTLEWAQITGFDANTIPIVAKESALVSGGAATKTLTSSAQAFTAATGQSLGPSGYARPPAWATHVCFKADFASMNAGSIYLDGLVFNGL